MATTQWDKMRIAKVEFAPLEGFKEEFREMTVASDAVYLI